MIPSAFVTLDAFPLTANGKLDRKALPAPEGAAYAVNAYQAPSGATQEALAQVWSEVLRRDPIGVNDNFFDVGGDSIRSIAIVAKAREHGLALAIVDIFKAPTIAALAAVLDARDAVTEQRTDVAFMTDADRARLPASVVDAYPVTMLQMGMVFHNQYEQEAGLYHEVSSHCIDLPSWQPETMRIVLDAMGRKHPVLRTSFDLHNYSEALQLVHAEAPIPLIVTDISALDSAAQDLAVHAFLDQELKRSFDLATAPLLRIFIHVRSPNKIQYTFSGHHAILDGWSVASLQTELFKQYTALCASGARSLSLAPLALTPKVSAVREREALQSPSQRAFWSGYLAEREFSALPPAEEAGNDVARVRSIDLPDAVCLKLQTLASELEVPMRTLLLSAHMRLLATLSGKTDVTTGLVTNVRPEETDGDKVLGLFLNTLPFRQDLQAASWRALVRATYAAELDVMQHRDYPYFQLHLDNGRQPLYDIVFNYINFHVYDELDTQPEDGGLTKSFEATGYGLGVSCSYQKGRGIHLDMDAKAMPPAQVERILGYFVAILTSMATAPDSLHTAHDFMADTERRQLLQGVQGAAADWPRGELIHQLFEQHAAAQPHALAAAFGAHEISYGELNARANQLAHHLLALGVKPDDRVAICATRGIGMVAGLLGILKAGAGYVPLDPAYPADRLAFMLGDSAPVALLTEAALAAGLPPAGVPLVLLDDPQRFAHHPAANPDPAALGLSAEHLAYVIYTSGSTGQPKGVMNAHRGLCNLARAQIDTFGVRADSRVLQFVSLSFDVCISEITMALCSGASLHLAPAAALLPGEPLLATLRERRISHVSLPMAVLAALPADAQLGEVHTLIVGGEALPPALADNWSARYKLFNSYGPTEATVCATVYRCHAPNPPMVPIGRPLANNRIYILDGAGRPAPFGVTGEIHIGGVQVARGYLNRPELTAQRFIADPFSLEPGARLYKTGDLGRWLADGNIDFMGRNDHQVKLRGFRIELGEIESTLLACDGVREAVVVAREDAPGDKRLVAYLVAHDGAALAPSVLRAHLAAQLADYMVPAAFVVLDALPLTPNGKLDRKALPASANIAIPLDYVAPRNATEEQLARVWCELLRRERIGVNENFFESGGHSLLLVKMHSELSAAFPGRLAIADYFTHNSIARLAGFIDAGQVAAVRVPDAIARAETRKNRMAAQRDSRQKRTH